jgi:hypothetical protein
MYDYVFFTDVTDTLVSQKSIGAYKVANVLRENGRKCLVIDHLHTWSIDNLKTLVDRSIDHNTKAIGFSSTFLMDSSPKPMEDGSLKYEPIRVNRSVFPQGSEFEQEIIAYIKTKNAKIKVIAGGAKVHSNISNRNIDFVVVGYAETAILDIDQYIENNKSIPNAIKNVWGVTVIKNQGIENYDFQNSTFRWESTDVVNSKVLPIEIARGCIFKCKFCAYPMNGKKSLDFVRTSTLLEEELQRNYDQFGIKNYTILDDTFNDNEYKLDLILDAIQKLSFQPVFWAYTRLDLLSTKQHVNKLYEIGLRSFFFGIETMNSKTAKIIGKGYDRDRQIETIRDIRSRYPDVAMHGSFMIGLPEESKDSVINTLDSLLSQKIPLHSWQFSSLRLHKPSMAAWSSELDLNYPLYGYKALPTPEESPTINWQNLHMDCFEGLQLEKEFSQRSMNSNMVLSPLISWQLKNYGYSEEYATSTPTKNVNWHQISLDKEKFITEYQQKLLSLL